jgi:hypothetical protein
MLGILLSVLLISALLLVVNGAVSHGFSLLRGEVPSHGPTRYAVHAYMARQESVDLDAEYERLLRDNRRGGSPS